MYAESKKELSKIIVGAGAGEGISLFSATQDMGGGSGGGGKTCARVKLIQRG